MKFVYYLAAIGNNGLERKLSILSKNLNYIYKNINTKFDIIVNCYNSGDVINNFLQGFDFLNLKLCYNKPGVLTELFLTNPYNASLANYDYILFILDDVEIQNMNIRDMIKVKDKYKIEVLSPKVLNSTHAFMNTYDNNTLTLNNVVEVYCLLLRYPDFLRFISMHTLENKWMWGADFLFGYLNITAGVYNKYSVNHALLPSTQQSHRDNAAALMNIYLKKMNYVGSIKDIVPVKSLVNLTTGAQSVDNSNTNKILKFKFNNNYSGNSNIKRSASTLLSIKADKPNVNLANVHMPSVNMPSVNIPSVHMASIHMASVNMPSVNMVKVSKPSVSKPSVSKPIMNASKPIINMNKANGNRNKPNKFTIKNLMNM